MEVGVIFLPDCPLILSLFKYRGVGVFLGNVLVGVKVAFLPDCSLILSLLKHRGIRAFLN